jgi:SAM-dependent methyltransferase
LIAPGCFKNQYHGRTGFASKTRAALRQGRARPVPRRSIGSKHAREIVAVDPSEGFIAYAETRAKSTRVHFEVGDAQALKFKDASFDNTLALFVMNFIPDHNKAVAEMRRVTRAQGIVSACVWDYDSGMQMLRFFWDEAIALDPAVEPKDERHMKLSRQGQLGDLWKSAGLINIEEEPLAIDQPLIIQRLLGAVYERRRAGRRLRRIAFPESPANSLKLACASACLEIGRMARSH